MPPPTPPPSGASAQLDAVAEVVHQVTGLPVEQVRPERRFVDDLAVDSLAMVEILEGVGTRLGCRVEDEAARQFVHVGDLVDYLTHLAGRSA